MKLWVGLLVLLVGAPFLCFATPTYYSGFDTGINLGGQLVLGPNSLSAYNTFQSFFFNGNVATLDSVSLGVLNGTLEFGITAICSDCDVLWSGITNLSTNELGYNTTGATLINPADGRFYQVAGVQQGGNFRTSVLTLGFATPITAFGVYITGIQTTLGTTVVTFNDGAAQTFTLPNTGTTPFNPAGIQFFGFTDSNPVSSITFTTTNPISGFRDIWGFDDIWIGQEVPEPATLAMIGGGLLALGLLRRRLHR